MWDGLNNRKFPRVSLHCEVKVVRDEEPQTIDAVTDNVGQGGLCIIQPHELDRFSRCEVAVFLDDGADPIQCGGKVVWIVPRHDPQASGKLYDTGIEFDQLDETQQNRLKACLERSTGSGAFRDVT